MLTYFEGCDYAQKDFVAFAGGLWYRLHLLLRDVVLAVT